MVKTRKQRKQRKQRGKGQTCSRGICRTTPNNVVVPGARNTASFENPMRRAPDTFENPIRRAPARKASDTIKSLTLQNESLTKKNLELDQQIGEIQVKLDMREAELLTVPRPSKDNRSNIQKFINMYKKEIRTKQNMTRMNEYLIGRNEEKIQRMRQAAYNRNHPEEAAARQEAANAAALAAFEQENQRGGRRLDRCGI